MTVLVLLRQTITTAMLIDIPFPPSSNLRIMTTDDDPQVYVIASTTTKFPDKTSLVSLLGEYIQKVENKIKNADDMREKEECILIMAVLEKLKETGIPSSAVQ